jgi:hypothetical protein
VGDSGSYWSQGLFKCESLVLPVRRRVAGLCMTFYWRMRLREARRPVYGSLGGIRGSFTEVLYMLGGWQKCVDNVFCES